MAGFRFRFRWRTRPTEIPTKPYLDEVDERILQFLESWGDTLVGYAQANAPWEDRTGKARQELHYEVYFVEDTSATVNAITTEGDTTTVELKPPSKRTWYLILTHGVPYGLWLEVRWQGKYGILLPTMAMHQNKIMTEFRNMVEH